MAGHTVLPLAAHSLGVAVAAEAIESVDIQPRTGVSHTSRTTIT